MDADIDRSGPSRVARQSSRAATSFDGGESSSENADDRRGNDRSRDRRATSNCGVSKSTSSSKTGSSYGAMNSGCAHQKRTYGVGDNLDRATPQKRPRLDAAQQSTTKTTTTARTKQRGKGDDQPTHRHQYKGKVVTVRETVGFLRPLDELPRDYNPDKDVCFRLDRACTGYLCPKVGDVLDFTLGTKDKERPFALYVRMVDVCRREPPEWEAYLKGITRAIRRSNNDTERDELNNQHILCIPHECSPTDLLVNFLLCTALWEGLGNCCNIHDEEIVALLDMLEDVEYRAKSLEENFRSVLGILAQSRLLHQRNNRFGGFVSDVVHRDDKENLEKIEKFLMLLLKQVPDQSRLVVRLVKPIVESSRSPTCAYLYTLLNVAVKGSQGNVDDMDWDELPLVPSVGELLDGPLESSLNLQPVQVDRPYQSCLEYIDTYFRLLRRDCFNALNVGIRDLLNGSLDSRDMNVYRDVGIAGIQIKHQGIQGLSLAIQLSKDTPHDIEKSRKLMFGNLICITPSGSFRDPVWATVSNRELLKSHRMVTLDLCSECNNQTDAEVIVELQSAGNSLTMVESPTYYKAYQPVLRALQKLEPDNLALHEEIVHIHPPSVPSYIDQNTTMDASLLYENASSHMPVMQYCESAPDLGNTTLDASQEASVRSTLNNRVAIIQGPPGTGKTYIGVNLVKLLLSISTFPRQPILVLTYKNHALDEFLEDVLQVTDNIVRVGGRSKDPKLAKYTLQEMKKNVKMPEALFKQIQKVDIDMETYKKHTEEAFEDLQQSELLDVAGFSEYLTMEQIKFLLEGCNWSVTTIDSFQQSQSDDDDGPGKKRSRRERITRDEVIDVLMASDISQCDCLCSVVDHTRREQLQILLHAAFKQWLPTAHAFKEIEKQVLALLPPKLVIPKSHKVPLIGSDLDEREYEEVLKERLSGCILPGNASKEELLGDIRFLRDVSTSSCSGPHLFRGAKALMTNTPCGVLLGVDDLWSLGVDDRVRLVQYMMYTNFEEAGTDFKETLALYQKTCRIKNEIEEQHRINILRGQKVIGMTMTGASIYNHYLKAVRPFVVIVEEAAEVLEPQLIAALGDWTKHLILIGDHKQLRPSVESYVLARDYHLDVSMMERLIKNNQPYALLEEQSRMKPEFAELLLDIYPHLRSNFALVGNNRQADCIGVSMFFWETNDPETKERSCTNEGEAERAVRLALFLVQQEYQPKSITILAPYQGQVSLIRRKLREAKQTYKQMFEPFEPELAHSKENRDQHTTENIVRVYTIDMYQGDENDFVIISLVRSNPKGELGFLKVLNRRCVAQSRARRGMYFIGNRNLLESNRHWLKMITTMQEKGCTGTAISLHCPSHPTTSTITAVNAKDITLGAFCEKRCEVHMPCLEHICRKSCQPRHVHRPCVESVDFVFERCHHLGTKPCYKGESEMYCRQEVSMTFPKCGHSGHRLCYEEEESQLCPEACPLNFPCGHPCREQCGNACNPDDCPPCMEIKRIEAEKRREDEGKIRRRLEREITLQLEAMRRVRPGYFKHDLYPIGDTASEYLDAEDRVKKYIQPGHNWFPMITKIEKITNSRLEEKWLQEKLRLLDPRKRSELKFHGTTKEAIEAIISKGFKLPVRKKQMYGVGLYFASDSSKSAQEIYTKGSNMLLMSEVLLGKSLTVDSARTSMTHKELHELGYDSLFAKRGTQKSGGVLNDEFVVYHRDQAIPRYIIHYDATGINSDCGCFSDLEQQALLAGKLTKYSMHPKRTVNYTSDPLDIHFRMAESQFLRLMQRTGGNHTVTSVDYYINPLLLTKFQDKSHEFQTKYRAQDDAECILAFHGTNDDNIDSILNGNFRLDKCARGAFGAGIYFSEFPDISMGYGGKLLLCKVLPGRSYDCPGGMPNSALQPGYDSHRVQKDTQGRGRELVIYNPDQILPCYVINF